MKFQFCITSIRRHRHVSIPNELLVVKHNISVSNNLFGHLLLLHFNVQQVEKAQCSIHSSHPVVRQLSLRSAGYRPPGGFLQENLLRAGRQKVRWAVSDEDAVLDDSRSGNHKERPHQGLCAFSRPWHLLGHFGQPHVQQFVFHGEPSMENYEKQTKSRVHFRQTQGDVRSNQRVRRQPDEKYPRTSTEKQQRNRSERRHGKVFYRRDRNLRVRPSVECRER